MRHVTDGKIAIRHVTDRFAITLSCCAFDVVAHQSPDVLPAAYVRQAK